MKGRIRDIHFVGVGGIGMSGLAELLQRQGYRVTGSDLRDGPAMERLRGLGVDVTVGHDRVHVGDAQVVVVSSAVRPDNPEIVEAKARRIPVIGRAEMLAEVMRLHDGIAVGGSHGKTTTTSLIAHLLDAAGLDPTAVIGGRVLGGSERSGARLGRGRWLVAEADESDGSFLHLAPVISVVTNIDPEHLDHYGDYDRLRDAFVQFVNRVPFWGLAVLCIDHPGVQAILPRITRRYATYGFSSQAQWTACDVESAGAGMRFTVHAGGQERGRVMLPVPGRHNVLNALAALVVANELDVPFETSAEALARFGGVERRFERKGEAAGVTVVDDYAHHPAEIRATLAAARGVHAGRLVAVFQPHRYTRTRDCLDEFARAFNDSDRLIVTEVYAAGEEPIAGVSGEALAREIRAHGHRDVHFVASLDDVAERLVKELAPGDWVFTLGAGDVSRLGPLLLDRLGGRAR
jgi:UDP-N-acetylmuramate--alanine ligase